MKITIQNVLNAAVFGALLFGQMTIIPTAVRAEEHRYHDRDRHDDHVWNDREDRAYRMWLKETHRKHRDFDRLREEDRQAYWAWRHEHSDEAPRRDSR